MALINFGLFAVALLRGEDAGQLVGAKAAIADLTSHRPVAVASSLKSKFAAQVLEYARGSSNMPIPAAAKGWLDLLRAGKALPVSLGNERVDYSPRTLVGALPRPEVWPAIESQLPAYEPNPAVWSYWHMIFARLRGNDTELAKLTTGATDSMFGLANAELRSGALQRLRDLPAQVDAIVSGQMDSVPPLAALMPRQAAAIAVLRILKSAQKAVYFTDRPTNDLAREVMLGHLREIDFPQWALAEDATSRRMLVDRYGLQALCQAQAPTGVARQFFVDLLDRGRTDEAAKFAAKASLSSLGFLPLREPAANHQLFENSLAVAKTANSLDAWLLCADVAARSGFAREGAGLLAQFVRDSKLNSEDRQMIEYRQRELLSIAGDIAGLADALRKLVRDSLNKADQSFANDSLLRLGIQISDKSLIHEAEANVLALSLRDYADAYSEARLSERNYRASEDLQIRLIQDMIKMYGSRQVSADQNAYALCRTYYEAGKPSEIVELLKGFPYWSAPDLRSIVDVGDRDEMDGPGDSSPLGYYAAWGFAKTGQKDLAIKTLQATIVGSGPYDEVFALLNSLMGSKGLAFYDGLSHAPCVNPRVQMWRADLLRRLHRLKEAEATARKAITADPMDAHASNGRRFKGYEILGQILRDEGEKSLATPCDAKVRAVRHYERGLELMNSQLIPQAIDALRQAVVGNSGDMLAHFKLATCLASIGRRTEALNEFGTAFRLLPNGMGPQSKMPNGWQEALNDPAVRRMAEQVRAELVAHPKDKASHFHARAVLSEALGMGNEATVLAKRVVALEPNFYEGWLMLSRLGEDQYTTQRDSELANNRLLELQVPFHGLTEARLDAFSNLSAKYGELRTFANRIPEASPAHLYKLHSTHDLTPAPLSISWSTYYKRKDFPPGTYYAGLVDFRYIMDGFPGGG